MHFTNGGNQKKEKIKEKAAELLMKLKLGPQPAGYHEPKFECVVKCHL